MKKIPWFIIFLFVLIGELAAIQLQNELLQYIFKPLIIPVTAAAFISGAGTGSRTLKLFILGGLFFSWVGDILLMFDSRDELFFLLGLSAFLGAHVFYILFFHRLRVLEQIKSIGWLLLVVAVYYTSFILFLANYLGDKEWPVRAYGIVISFMLLLALHMNRIKNRTAGMMMMWGAILFVISDSVLALNKFYHAFEGAGHVVMITYAFAQWLIADGAARYLQQSQKD